MIRPAREDDGDAIWELFHAVVAGRDTYVFMPDTPRSEGIGYWFGNGMTSFVAELDGRVVGIYKLIANQPGLGSHVANASFMVHPAASGRGVGRTLAVHCLHQARRQGYEAIQFNFVVATNERAVALWQRLGFRIVGTLPRAFRHGTLGLVDALVMYRTLDDIVPTFGVAPEGVTPIMRPSAYAVVVNEAGAIAVVHAQTNVMLPGGALDEGESSERAALREVAEECAIAVTMQRSLGRAIQLVRVRTSQPVEKHSEFFAAVWRAVLPERTAEHHTTWMPPGEAEKAVTSPSHAWAINRWAKLST
jgi:ribosomal protein S18 acetylase RimI-like enzyme/8-oxo-dGTP pyrophosphatase MutT (NUDIX family)